MSYDHDTAMRAHAQQRGPVHVVCPDGSRLPGRLVSWRPKASGTTRTGHAYTARVDHGTRQHTYPLNRYTIEKATPCPH